MGQFVRNVRDLGEIVNAIRSQGKKVVYTSGIFDVFHIGQMRALQDAKSRGHYLVVGVHRDDFARERLEGGRPFLSFRDRVEFVEHLDLVDYVVNAESDEDESVLVALDADILATGVDTSLTINVDKKAVTKKGGRVVAVSSRRGPSVAQLLKKYRAGVAKVESEPKSSAKVPTKAPKTTKASKAGTANVGTAKVGTAKTETKAQSSRAKAAKKTKASKSSPAKTAAKRSTVGKSAAKKASVKKKSAGKTSVSKKSATAVKGTKKVAKKVAKKAAKKKTAARSGGAKKKPELVGVR